MATKTMNVGVAAYDALAARKQPGESFTDVILRLTRSSGLEALVGVLSDEEAERMKGDLRESRARSRARRDRMDARLGAAMGLE